PRRETEWGEDRGGDDHAQRERHSEQRVEERCQGNDVEEAYGRQPPVEQKQPLLGRALHPGCQGAPDAGVREQREEYDGQGVGRVAEEKNELLDEADLDEDVAEPNGEEESNEAPLPLRAQALTLKGEQRHQDEHRRGKDRDEQDEREDELTRGERVSHVNLGEVLPEVAPLIEVEEEGAVVAGGGQV